VRAEIEAEAMRMMNEAHNVLTPDARASALRLKLVEKAEAIIREAVRPMERIEGIKILHVEGLGGGGHLNGDGNGASSPTASSTSALRFRAQAPIVDQLLREIGLEAGDINRLAGGAMGGAAALPPQSRARSDAAWSACTCRASSTPAPTACGRACATSTGCRSGIPASPTAASRTASRATASAASAAFARATAG
jgi:hypothetical protein